MSSSPSPLTSPAIVQAVTCAPTIAKPFPSASSPPAPFCPNTTRSRSTTSDTKSPLTSPVPSGTAPRACAKALSAPKARTSSARRSNRMHPVCSLSGVCGNQAPTLNLRGGALDVQRLQAERELRLARGRLRIVPGERPQALEPVADRVPVRVDRGGRGVHVRAVLEVGAQRAEQDLGGARERRVDQGLPLLGAGADQQPPAAALHL